MKTMSMITKSLIAVLFLVGSTSLFAQDAMKNESMENVKVLLDNEKVTVIQVEFVPGYQQEMHAVPDGVGYVLEGGQLEITEEGKDPNVVTFNPVEVMYITAQKHALKNVGTTTIKLVVTMFKENHMMKSETSDM